MQTSIKRRYFLLPWNIWTSFVLSWQGNLDVIVLTRNYKFWIVVILFRFWRSLQCFPTHGQSPMCWSVICFVLSWFYLIRFVLQQYNLFSLSFTITIIPTMLLKDQRVDVSYYQQRIDLSHYDQRVDPWLRRFLCFLLLPLLSTSFAGHFVYYLDSRSSSRDCFSKSQKPSHTSPELRATVSEPDWELDFNTTCRPRAGPIFPIAVRQKLNLCCKSVLFCCLISWGGRGA